MLQPIFSTFPADSAQTDLTGKFMQKILIINTKGGCGKTTIATNLAANLVHAGHVTALFDYDPQGSSMNWLQNRPTHFPVIQGVPAHKTPSSGMTKSWAFRLEPGTTHVILDTPAAVPVTELSRYVYNADRILLPVLPSAVDIHATSAFLNELRKLERVRGLSTEIGLIVNRVRGPSKAMDSLNDFLQSLSIPVVARLRDSLNYVHAMESGIAVCEMDKQITRRDKGAWAGLLRWLQHDRDAVSLASGLKKEKTEALPSGA